jgi:hypothetical protein
MLDMLGSAQHWALIGATETGVLEDLRDGPADLGPLARELELSERGPERLLELPEPMG